MTKKDVEAVIRKNDAAYVYFVMNGGYDAKKVNIMPGSQMEDKWKEEIPRHIGNGSRLRYVDDEDVSVEFITPVYGFAEYTNVFFGLTTQREYRNKCYGEFIVVNGTVFFTREYEDYYEYIGYRETVVEDGKVIDNTVITNYTTIIQNNTVIDNNIINNNNNTTINNNNNVKGNNNNVNNNNNVQNNNNNANTVVNNGAPAATDAPAPHGLNIKQGKYEFNGVGLSEVNVQNFPTPPSKGWIKSAKIENGKMTIKGRFYVLSINGEKPAVEAYVPDGIYTFDLSPDFIVPGIGNTPEEKIAYFNEVFGDSLNVRAVSFRIEDGLLTFFTSAGGVNTPN